MHTIKSALRVLSCLCFLAATCLAQVTKAKGKGQSSIQAASPVGSAQSDIRKNEAKALESAKANALIRYASTLEPSRYEMFKRVEGKVMADFERFILDYIQIDSQIDSTGTELTIIIEATINTQEIEREIKSLASDRAGNGEKAAITFVFVAREQAAIKMFDAKKTTVDMDEESNKSVSSEQSNDGSSTSSNVVKKTSGGNTEIKADQVTYKVSTVTEVDNAVNSVLAKAGYETIDSSDAGLSTEAFKEEFSQGNDLSTKTRTETIEKLRAAGIEYMVIANLDVGMPEKDAVSGLAKIFVSVTAKVTFIPKDDGTGKMSVRAKLPKTVASIAGKPYSGLGNNAQVARLNALNEAAERSAIELTDQLRTKNIK